MVEVTDQQLESKLVEEGEDSDEKSPVRSVVKAESFIKVPVVLRPSGTGYWDRYHIPNQQNSWQSPNSYRIVNLDQLNSLFDYNLLRGIEKVVQQYKLYDELQVQDLKSQLATAHLRIKELETM